MSTDDVENELFESITKRRYACLASAAESASSQEHKANTDESEILLQMMEQFLLDLGKLEASRFRELFGQASYWIGFRKNPTDRD